MERINGRDVDMEDRLHSRLRSKVPRARYAPASRFGTEFEPPSSYESRNGTQKIGHPTPSHPTLQAPAIPQQPDTDETKEWKKLLGERVCISGVKQGILRYYGRTNFAQGLWCGVELDEAVGKNNGTVSGVVYFRCRPNHGIFAPTSKVSKLNDLSGAPQDWREDHGQSQNNLDYNVRYTPEELYHHDRKFIRTSRSDPTFLMNAVRTVLPHNSESFPYDDRRIMELRESAFTSKHKAKPPPLAATMNYEPPSLRRERSPFATGDGQQQHTNITSNPLTACLLSKYGYGAKAHFGSNVVRLTEEDGETSNNANRSYRQAEFLQKVQAARVQASSHRGSISSSSSFSAAKEEYDNYFMKKSSDQASPPTEKHYSGMQFLEEYRMSTEKLPNTYMSSDYPHEEEEFLLHDDDDQMSMDCDESLGILTPNQMKDFTLLVDTPQATTCSDLRGMNFPSSESFDDINDLPEDEQVHDVSVHYLPESLAAKRSLEVAKKAAFQKTKVVDTEFEIEERHVMVSSTDKFLVSISSKELDDLQSELTSDGRDCDLSVDLSKTLTSNLEEEIKNELSSQIHLEIEDLNSDVDVMSKKHPNVSTGFNVPPSEPIETTGSVFCELSMLLQSSKEARLMKEKLARTSTEMHNISDNKKLKLIAMESLVEEGKSKKNDSDSSRDSLLHVDQEQVTSKEKLTVSWEDCVIQNPDVASGLVERPDSVYTVASNDTGYQEEDEDGEFDGDNAVMATSMESTEDSKRFSTASRDSCIVTEDVDGYKIAESNSTSGYSTGLSDSCCNDRHDDDSASCKPLTDESIQDSVGPCDSEDAFSLQESMDAVKETVIETSDVTETETALFADSTSDALCETMVEDSTLTEIHELLMSPDDNAGTAATSPKDEVKESDTTPQDQSSTLPVGETEPAIIIPSCKSTPEKRPLTVSSNTVVISNRSRSSARIDLQRNQRPAVINKSPRKPDQEATDREKQMAVVKSPKKNVMSKIKAMIEATSCKTIATKSSKPETPTEAPAPRRVVSAPKKSRWEAVTSKIAASLAEEKTKPKVKRDIKSKVDTNLTMARQVGCKSPRLDSPRMSIRDGSMSPTSVSSRDRRPLERMNSSQSSLKEDRTKEAKDGLKSPRHLQRLLSLMAGCAPVCRMTYVIQTPPGPGKASSRSTSPVAPSESSTNSVSLNSHNSRSKIAQWKGSNSTVGSAAVVVPVAPVKKPVVAATPTPRVKPPLQTAKTLPPSRMVTKKPTAATKSRPLLAVPLVGGPPGRPSSPAGASTSGRVESVRSSPSHKQLKHAKEHGTARGIHHPSPKPVRPPMWLSKAELTQEIQHLGNLCEARTKELNRLKMETKHITVGFDAFAALFKYMAEDLNAFSVPKLVEDLEKTLKQLELTKQDLAYYEKEVEELKVHHCQELTGLSDKLFATYQAQVAELNSKHQEELNHIKCDHQKQVENLSNNFNLSSEDVKLQHEKLISSLEQELIKQREELQMFQESEIKDLEEKHEEGIKALQSQIEQLQKKCSELKQHSTSMEDAMKNDTDTKLQWVTLRKIDLEKEVESLKTVLEMKNQELHTLRVQKLEMDKLLEELPLARERVKMLQARAEDLEALMDAKTKLERKLSTENMCIRETYERESKVNKRLSMENEELQWRLRQAEHSLITDSFTEEASDDLPVENEIPMTPPSHSVSRSVFFTFVDKDDMDRNTPQSPGSQYKKINRSFSASYKTSPARTFKSHSSTTSPKKSKSHSEPPQPIVADGVPKKVTKQPLVRSRLYQKRQRYESDNRVVQTNDVTDAICASVNESMASSASSESSVFEQKERLLEEHKDQIIVSLDILREQRSAEEAMDEAETPCDADKNWCSDNSVISHSEMAGMSQSGDFTDPKTYYHMTFPVLKGSGTDCDIDDDCKDTSSENSPDKETEHSILKNERLVHSDIGLLNEELNYKFIETCEIASINVNHAVNHNPIGVTDRLECEGDHVKAAASTEGVDSSCESQEKVQNRWHTM